MFAILAAVVKLKYALFELVVADAPGLERLPHCKVNGALVRLGKIAIATGYVALSTLLAVCAGSDYISHLGNTDPTSEGWTFNGGAVAVGQSELGYDYWGINDLTTTFPEEGYYSYTPTNAQRLNSWRLSDVVRVVTAPTGQAGVTNHLADGTSILQMMWDSVGWHYKNSSNVWTQITPAATASYHRYDAIANLTSPGSHSPNDEFSFHLNSHPILTVDRSDLRSFSNVDLGWGNSSDVTRSQAHWNEVVFTGDLTIPDPPPAPMLDRGHRVLLEKGLQIQAMITPHLPYNPPPDAAYWSTLDAANFTTPYMNISGMEHLPAIPGGRQWSLHARGNWPVPEELVPELVSIQYRDEQDLGNPATLAEASAQFAIYRNAYPDVILYTNQFGWQISEGDMRNYMSVAQPDMLSFDHYPWVWGKTEMYQYMQKYRLLALGGNDGSGNRPIPYGRYVQSFTFPGGHIPTQSEINLDYFASWAFGFKQTNAFTYDRAILDPPQNPILFEGGEGTQSEYENPTEEYDNFSEVNLEGQNLGPTLLRLLSTDVRLVPGENSTLPPGVSAWSSTAGHNQWYMENISATNIGGGNQGQTGDVVIGYFKPLLETFDGHDYERETYFMIVNGLTHWDRPGGSGPNTRQRITVDFDFGGSGVTSLQRLNRTTGALDILDGLQHLGGTRYSYILELDGGKGEIFKYNTGAPFIGSTSPMCDFNLDSACDVVDIDLMYQQGNLVAGVSVSTGSLFDRNGDQLIDEDDLNIWLAEAATVNGYGYGSPYLRGDTDNLGTTAPDIRTVDITDFNALSGNFLPVGDGDPTNGPFWYQGNFDGDHDIDITDFNFLASNFAPDGYGASAVPEPSSLLLALLGLMLLARARVQ